MSGGAAGNIKGTGFESAVTDVQRLVSEGRLSRAEVDANLSPDERALIEQRVLASSWYSLSTYDKLMQLLLEKEGGGDVAYFVERGRRAADRLYKAGLYRQLEATLARWGENFGPLMATLGSAMFSDTEWKIERRSSGGGQMHHIDVNVPAGFPDCARYAAAGFIEYLGSRASGGPVTVRESRPAPTRVVFEVHSR
jgi:hypothetical protein